MCGRFAIYLPSFFLTPVILDSKCEDFLGSHSKLRATFSVRGATSSAVRVTQDAKLPRLIRVGASARREISDKPFSLLVTKVGMWVWPRILAAFRSHSGAVHVHFAVRNLDCSVPPRRNRPLPGAPWEAEGPRAVRGSVAGDTLEARWRAGHWLGPFSPRGATCRGAEPAAVHSRGHPGCAKSCQRAATGH